MKALRNMRSKQTGLAAVELAIVGTVLFLTIFTVIEIARLLWVWESLTEATRRGARVAAVCPVDNDGNSPAQNVAVFNDPNTSGGSAILNGLTTVNVLVEYLNETGGVLGTPANDDWCDIEFVRVSIQNYNHQLLIPFVNINLTAPGFSATIPRESLGVVPGVGYQCYGNNYATPVCS